MFKFSPYSLKKSLQKEHIAKHLQSAVAGVGPTEGEDMEQECIPLGDMSGEYYITHHMFVMWLPHVLGIV